MRRYNPKEIEAKWQKVWSDTGLYKTDESEGEQYYCLVMFPYPSGNLHVGHWYNFGPADAVARYNRMLGKKILHPIGFDSFGLPAENAAIKNDIPPAEWTSSNIESMTKQIDSIGTMYDMEKVISTSSPDYYKWTQWIFLNLYKNDLAYKKKALVNWCPKDKTVLANEQVVGENNECDRCGTPVIQKDLAQWFFKITDYAEQLEDDLEGLDWPNRVKTMQKNWIGKSSGAEIRFEIEDHLQDSITIFTTRPDTIFGATYIVLAPEHELVAKVTTQAQKDEVEEYVEHAKTQTELERKAEKDKTGVFTGAYALNPANGEKLPIWIADFVLASYGHGAIFADAHDERDFEFGKKFGIKLKPTIIPDDEIIRDDVANLEICFTGEGELYDSGDFSGMRTSQARDKITKWLQVDGRAKEQTNYKLRDWLISRQRYWGAPIPIIYCDECGTVPVPEKDLPVVLPEDVAFEPTGQSPLTTIKEFIDTKCPECGGPAERETDTMDTFVDSSWYFLRYPNTKFEDGPFDPEAVKKWAPVDHYIGGIEHAILHLLYARFITKALHDNAGLPFIEPFKKLSNQGMILGPDGAKMSKSKGNVIDPDDQVGSYGADSLRLYLMFMGPYDQGGPYDFGGIAGVRRFIERVWNLTMEFQQERESGRAAEPKQNQGPLETQLVVATQKTVKKVTEDLQSLSFNTAIASMMELVNTMNKLRQDLSFANSPEVWHEQLETLLRLLAPFGPHFTEEVWSEYGNGESIHLQGWPTWDKDLITDDIVKIVVQVNGKVRGTLEIEKDAPEVDIEAAALELEKVKNHLDGKEVVKKIHVPNKLLSLVVS